MKLVFLYLNVMYLKEIPCLNKVTLLTLPNAQGRAITLLSEGGGGGGGGGGLRVLRLERRRCRIIFLKRVVLQPEYFFS